MAVVKPSYNIIPAVDGEYDPNASGFKAVDFVSGNIGENVTQIINSLATEQEVLTSHFVLVEGDEFFPQSVNNELVLQKKPRLNPDINSNFTDNQLITKKYCDDKHNTIPNLDKLQYCDISSSLQTQLTNLTNEIDTKQDIINSTDNFNIATINDNDITNLDKLVYLDVSSSLNTTINTIISSFQGQINQINANDVQRGEANIWTNQNTFQNYAVKCDISPVNDDDLTNKFYVDEALNGVNQELNTINTSITTINNNIGDIEDDLTNLNGNITSINTSITNLSSSLNAIANAEVVDLGDTNIWTAQNTFNNYAPKCAVAPTLNDSLTNKLYVDNAVNSIQIPDISSKQDLLTSSSEIDLLTINGNSLTNLNKLQYLDVTGSISTSLTNLTNSINAIQPQDLSGKQDVLTSSSDIVVNTINAADLTNLPQLQYLDVSSSLTASIATLQSNIDGKQDTIGTNLNVSTINSNDLTNLDKLQYLDVSSGLTSLLSGKQATINSSSNLSVNGITLGSSTFSNNSAVSKSYVDSQNLNDAQLNGTNNFTSMNTFTAGLTLPTGSYISCNSTNISDVELSYLDGVSSSIQNQLNSKQASLTSSSDLSISSLLTKSISENFNAITTGTNAFTLDLSSGSVFYLSSGSTLNANFSVRLNNCGSNTAVSKVCTLIYNTTGKWIPNSMTCYSDTTTQITLASSTPLYMGGTPSISTSTIMIAQFSLVRLFASNYVLASVSSFY